MIKEKKCRKTDITLKQFKDISNSSYDGIFVTNNIGEVIFCNQACSIYLGKPSEDIIGKNVKELLKEGRYSNSVIIESIKKKEQVTGLVKLKSENIVLSTCTPIFSSDGDLALTVTNVRVDSVLETYLKAIQEEKDKVTKYKRVVNYLSNINSKKTEPIAESKEMKEILRYSERIAKTDTVVLILGESGTGKDVISKYIHNSSNRVDEPYIPVNCAAIPENLMESEFFGYEKGAFSGALNEGKAGYFEMADKGTLFLDEIGDMSLAVQAKILRVLETGKVFRLGSTEAISTDVRVIAATNRDLYKMVKEKKFREDLYYRLNILPLKIPPLRDRKEDILALAEHFLNLYNEKYNLNKKLSKSSINMFLQYSWPGNIRELKNILERFFIISDGDYIKLPKGYFENNLDNSKDIDEKSLKRTENSNEELIDLKMYMDIKEEEYIREVLNRCNNIVADASEVLGIHRTMLYRKIKKYNINI